MQITDAINLIENNLDFKILRSINNKNYWKLDNCSSDMSRRGLFVDIETTGLIHQKDKIIEICLIPFLFNQTERKIEKILFDQIYQSFNDPQMLIPPEATRVHGIRDKDVKGHTLDLNKVNNLINSSDRKSTRLNSSHTDISRMPSSA